ncbi:hypothetical protein VTO42DRAFT_2965 [Malbranchea cinnamomea]
MDESISSQTQMVGHWLLLAGRQCPGVSQKLGSGSDLMSSLLKSFLLDKKDPSLAFEGRIIFSFLFRYHFVPAPQAKRDSCCFAQLHSSDWRLVPCQIVRCYILSQIGSDGAV